MHPYRSTTYFPRFFSVPWEVFGGGQSEGRISIVSLVGGCPCVPLLVGCSFVGEAFLFLLFDLFRSSADLLFYLHPFLIYRP